MITGQSRLDAIWMPCDAFCSMQVPIVTPSPTPSPTPVVQYVYVPVPVPVQAPDVKKGDSKKEDLKKDDMKAGPADMKAAGGRRRKR